MLSAGRVGALAAVLVVGACGPATSQPTGEPTPAPTGASTAAPSPGATVDVPQTPGATSSIPNDPFQLGDDHFTAPPDPLNLDITLEDDAAATAEIGSEGGSITATAADGSKFTLTIPANALAFRTPITMTPLESVGGFPEELGVEHHIGVSLSPDGLELAETATLLIEPSTDLPLSDVYALGFRGAGKETGFHMYDRVNGGATLPIDHFSGYEVAFPLLVGTARPSLLRRMFSQTQIEAMFESEVAGLIAWQRQLVLLGHPEPFSLTDVALGVLSQFKRVVISPRVAAASQGCVQAQQAISAYLTYQRMRQLLGVGDDPAFDLVGAGSLAPDDLVDLTVELCMREEYLRCKRTGDLPGMMAYFLTFFRRIEFLRVEPKPEHVALAQKYLQGCGRWRVRVNTTHIQPTEADPYQWHIEATREIQLEWKPGSGVFGIVGSTIEGTGPVDATLIEVATCQSVSNVRSTADATAAMTLLSFDHYEGPTLTGDRIPPVPAKLTLEIKFGEVSHHRECQGTGVDDYDRFAWAYVLNAHAHDLTDAEKFILLFQVDEGTNPAAVFDQEWQYSDSPYRATLVQEDTLLYSEGPYGKQYAYIRNEIVVTHEPQDPAL
jgi:hypothetical protein